GRFLGLDVRQALDDLLFQLRILFGPCQLHERGGAVETKQRGEYFAAHFLAGVRGVDAAQRGGRLRTAGRAPAPDRLAARLAVFLVPGDLNQLVDAAARAHRLQNRPFDRRVVRAAIDLAQHLAAFGAADGAKVPNRAELEIGVGAAAGDAGDDLARLGR